jgi:NAD(P)-dependent dehydrogenase (short-subunit alcohol dehydrogenase family)
MTSSKPKIVLITGATRGLGLAMTDEFIRRNHTVIGCGRSPGQVAALSRVHPAPHDFQVVDVASDAAVAAWAASLIAAGTIPDLILNNAAIINRNAPLWKVGAEEFSQVIDINIKGVTNVIRHFTPAMIRRGSGVIVNFSSGWGRSTNAEVAPYCATKWAIEGLTQAFAQDLPHGLAAVALNPGIINTDMLQSCFSGSADSYPKPEAWARRAVPFLLGLGAEHNGNSLDVD